MPEDVDREADRGVGRGLGAVRRGPVDEVTGHRAVVVGVAVAALGREADHLHQLVVAVLLLVVRLLGREERLQVALGLGLLRPRLEADEVRDGDGRQDADDRDDDHELDQREALVLAHVGGESFFGWVGGTASARRRVPRPSAVHVPPVPNAPRSKPSRGRRGPAPFAAPRGVTIFVTSTCPRVTKCGALCSLMNNPRREIRHPCRGPTRPVACGPLSRPRPARAWPAGSGTSGTRARAPRRRASSPRPPA